MLGDLRSKHLIVLKGILFGGCVLGSAGLLIAENRSWETVGLVSILIWASARFYYFLFYVLEKYVDPKLKYAGIMDMIQQIARRKDRS
jgi:hypothetical protein